VIEDWMVGLRRLAVAGEHSAIIEHLKRLVPEYQPFRDMLDEPGNVESAIAVTAAASA